MDILIQSSYNVCIKRCLIVECCNFHRIAPSRAASLFYCCNLLTKRKVCNFSKIRMVFLYYYTLQSLLFDKNTRAAANSKRDCCYWVLLSPWVCLQQHSPNWSKINKQIKECYPSTSLRLCILLSQLACCCNNFGRLLQISLTAANTNQNQTLKNLLFCKFGSAKMLLLNSLNILHLLQTPNFS